jgi:hypothetical protein
MTKGQKSRGNVKKKPQKTQKEKRQERKDKKNNSSIGDAFKE